MSSATNAGVNAIQTNSVVLKPDGSAISYDQAIEDLIEATRKELIVISPFLSFDLLKNHERLDENDAPAVRIVICPGYGNKESAAHVFTHQLNPTILMQYRQRGFDVRKNCNLHSKIVVSDRKTAILGSANLSEAAFNPERWETGVAREIEDIRKSFLYKYIKKLLEQSEPVRKREIERWFEVLEAHRAKSLASKPSKKNLMKTYPTE